MPARRRTRESVVPMINVVFLLLIFFLMSAQIAPPEPFEVTPPDAQAGEAVEAGRILYIASDGAMALGDARGEAVFAALAGWDGDVPLSIRADRALEAERLAALLPRLAQAGVRRVKLVAGTR